MWSEHTSMQIFRPFLQNILIMPGNHKFDGFHEFNVAPQGRKSISGIRSPEKALKPQIWPVLQSQNCAKIRKINSTWPKPNQFWRWSR